MSDIHPSPFPVNAPTAIGSRSPKRPPVRVFLPLALLALIPGFCCLSGFRVFILPTPAETMLAMFCTDLNAGDFHEAYQFFDFRYADEGSKISENEFASNFPSKRTFACSYQVTPNYGFVDAESAFADLALVTMPDGPLHHYTLSLGHVDNLLAIAFSPDGAWRILGRFCGPWINNGCTFPDPDAPY